MTKLEEIKRGCLLKGLLPSGTVSVVDVKWHGSTVVELTYKDAAGRPGNELLYRNRESDLEVISEGKSWSFDAKGDLFRLVSEAYRIRLGYLFDPLLAVSTSLVQPLPHQITAVYGEMLNRQPLRYLLADDPGAGKTIMAGLFIKELLVRADLRRCLIISPGNLAEQWQDELWNKFNLDFEIITRERVESSKTGNPFTEIDLAIGRLDLLSRNEELQSKLEQTDWDLVICDEAHKMSATYFGNEVKYTKRYRLGQLASRITRHFLLMTATPHNGKEEDFQLFMALLDGDRFEGRFRDGVHVVDTSDMMRRMIKEGLVKFDGTPLFPERRAYTVKYKLSDEEAALYKSVTDYVREEFNRADTLENEGRKGNVGFALTILQRRLASSPEAIYQSLSRRKKRLETRLREEELLRRGAKAAPIKNDVDIPDLTEEELEDLDDAPDSEVEATEDKIIDLATAANTIEELKAEIQILKDLEQQASKVLHSGRDRKWEELSRLLYDNKEMFGADGQRRKLVIFTEHRDTLNYLIKRIGTLTGRPESIVTIHGGMGRDERKKAELSFTQDKETHFLVATDAAGEGINLQRAHLMVCYDLPWNPNRLEQRFGRIHRIGQTEVCHLWNLVASETREGDVLVRLCEKLEQESIALHGQVFDVLGKAFGERSLRDLLLEAIRYGDSPEVKAKLTQVVDEALDRQHIQALIDERALSHDSMDASKIRKIREDMERAEAKRLQPHFIQSFFGEAFRHLGGTISERESKRFEIKHVPALIRNRDRQIGTREPVLERYQRVTFEKDLINVQGKPMATFICPGTPLLDSTIDIILERYRSYLKQGAILVDDHDPEEEVRGLFYLEHAVQDGRLDRSGDRRIVSRQLQFVEIDSKGKPRNSGYAPYLDYRPVTEKEATVLKPNLNTDVLSGTFEDKVMSYAISELVPAHFDKLKASKDNQVETIMAAVKDRLTKEITYWDHRAEEIRLKEQAGKNNSRLNSTKALQRADELQGRLEKRMNELKQEKQLSARPPVIIGGAIVVPAGLLARLAGIREKTPAMFARETERVELAAMLAVLQAERALGFDPVDVSSQKLGWDIESGKSDGRLRFIEVKGRIKGATTVTISKNEILAGLNKPDDFILAVVIVPPAPEAEGVPPWLVKETGVPYVTEAQPKVFYIRKPFTQELDFGVTSVNYNLQDLLEQAEKPW